MTITKPPYRAETWATIHEERYDPGVFIVTVRIEPHEHPQVTAEDAFVAAREHLPADYWFADYLGPRTWRDINGNLIHERRYKFVPPGHVRARKPISPKESA